MYSLLSSLRFGLGHSSLLLAWLIPDQVPPWTTFHHEFFMVLGIFLLVPWRQPVSFSPFLLKTLLFWVVCILFQIPFHNISLDDAIFGFLVAGLISLAIHQGMQAALADKQQMLGYSIDSWYGVILIAGLVSGGVGFAQWIGVDLGLLMTESSGRAYGNFGQPNHFATLLVMAISSLVYFDVQNKLKTPALACMAAILCCALAISESRTGALGLTLLCFFALLLGRRSSLFNSLRWLGPCYLAFVALYANLSYIGSWMGGKVLRTGVGLGSSGRAEMWMQMVEAIQQRPLVGFGWLRLGASHFLIGIKHSSVQNIDHAHNLFLDLFIWFGLPLGLGMAAAIVYFSLQLLCSSWRGRTNGVALCGIGTLIPFAVHSMLEYPYAYMYFLLTAAFMVGVIIAKNERCGGWVVLSRRWCQFGVFAMLSLSALIACEYIKIEDDYRAVRLENQFRTRPEERHIFHSPPRLLVQYGDLVSSQRGGFLWSSQADSVQVARRLAERFPWLSTHLKYYIVLIDNKLCDEATDQWRIYVALFGEYGVVKAQEQIEKMNLDSACPQSRIWQAAEIRHR